MLDPFPNRSAELSLLSPWRNPPPPGPEEGLDIGPIPITPNKPANIFRTIRKKSRKKNKHARKSRAKNR